MPKVAKIIGSGVFPMDMLRYDRAYPVSESDSVTISATFFNKTGYYEVLVATSLPKFTTDRWQSFGVKVIPVHSGDNSKILRETIFIKGV